MHSLYANFVLAEPAFQVTCLAYFAALLAYAASFAAHRLKDVQDRIYLGARLLFTLAWGLNAYTLITDGLAADRPPFKTLAESLVYFCVLFGLIALSGEWLKPVRLRGLLSLLILCGALGWALGKADFELATLPPSLQSAWFLPHATFYFLGYGAFTAAFVVGMLSLLRQGNGAPEPGTFWALALGSAEVDFETLNRQWIRFGFFMLACGLVTGSLWAKCAWGDRWGWDPKETWGLLNWLVYAGVLHMHHVPGLKGPKAVWASLLAWGFVLFVFFGMGLVPASSQSMHRFTERPAPGEGQNLPGVNKQMD